MYRDGVRYMVTKSIEPYVFWHTIKQKRNMNKKSINVAVRTSAKTLHLLTLAFTASIGLASCNNDDDENLDGETGDVAIAGFETNNGQKVRVVKAGSATYSYNGDGALEYIDRDGEIFNATYNPFTLTGILSMEGDAKAVYSGFKTSNMGYVTGLNVEYSYKGTNYEEYNSGTINIAYNKNGNITKQVIKYDKYVIEEGHKYNASINSTLNCTWNNGNLMSINFSSDKDEYKTWKVEYTYDSNALTNITRQYVPAFMNKVTSLLTEMFYIGMFGKGPAMLPTGYTISYVYNDEDGKEHTEHGTCSYTLNSDGTVKSFTGMGATNENMEYTPVNATK